MIKDLDVSYEGKLAYHIFLEDSYDNFLEKLKNDANFADSAEKKICIVTDFNVANLYLDEVQNLCQNHFAKVETFIFPAGEASKNLTTVEKLYQDLINSHFDRGDFLLALGGGVVGDLTGYAAATYLRGIRFIQMPTTLLSQVDSSIGGKTGVDFLQYKNMVGAFYMPSMVYINVSTLKSLPEVQFQSGMGEVIKHGLIQDADYYQWLKSNRDAILSLEADALMEMVSISCQIKRTVVQEDPKEQGIRAYLNFGHTLGHAVEKLSDFSLYHGQCVAIGMVGAAYLSVKTHGLSENDFADIVATIEAFGLPTAATDYVADEILFATKSDKKMTSSGVKFVVLEKLGEAAIDKSYSDAQLLEAIGQILK